MKQKTLIPLIVFLLGICLVGKGHSENGAISHRILYHESHVFFGESEGLADPALALYTVNCEFIYSFEFYLIFKF